MEHYKYVILGAGPSGLSFAHTLRLLGEESFLVIEKENEAGGLCRSVEVDGKPLDIGGGHFLDLKRKEVLELVFRFMPREEWNEHQPGFQDSHPRRRTRSSVGRQPVAASRRGPDRFPRIHRQGGRAYAANRMPEGFADWIIMEARRLHRTGVHAALQPQNLGRWTRTLLGTYWLYKLPDVSFRETLQSCLEHRMFGALPAHGTFLYPKEYGYGEVWRRMGEALGDKLHLGEAFTSVDPATRTVNGRYQANCIVNSIPWTAWTQAGPMPDEVRAAIGRLVQVPIDVDYVADTLPSDSHWTYDPDETKSFHRLLLRSNFCPGSKGLLDGKPTRSALPRSPPARSVTRTNTPTRSTHLTSRRRWKPSNNGQQHRASTRWAAGVSGST